MKLPNNFGRITVRRSHRYIIILIVAITLVLASSEVALAWGSLTGARSHQYILDEAYKKVKEDPAFEGSGFPLLKDIKRYEGISWGFGGPTWEFARTYGGPEWMYGYFSYFGKNAFIQGLGPDSPGKSRDSEHYYNPRTGKGDAPTSIASHYLYLTLLLLDLIQEEETEDKLNQSAEHAAYLAHFIADLSVPFHINGMPADEAAKKINSGNGVLGENIAGNKQGGLDWTESLNNWSTVYKKDQLVFLNPAGTIDVYQDKRIFIDPSGEITLHLRGGNVADWFDPWYYDSNPSTHLMWEAMYGPESPIFPGSENKLRGYSKDFIPIISDGESERVQITKSIQKFAEQIAKTTDDLQDSLWQGGVFAIAQHKQVSAAYDRAITNVYTAWRASISALRPDIEVGSNTEQGSKKLIVKIKNVADKPQNENGQNVGIVINVSVEIINGSCIYLTDLEPYIAQNEKINQALGPGEEIAIDDKWELKCDKNCSSCSQIARFRVIVIGEFKEAPDSGMAIIEKNLTIDFAEATLAPQECPDVDYSKLKKIEEEKVVYYEDSNGLKQGPYTLYYDIPPHKQTIETGCFLDGKETGHWIGYYDKGDKSYEGYYRDGKMNGHWIRYDYTGNKSQEGYYINGNETGHWTNWENGHIRSEGDMKDGDRNGHWIDYYWDGNKSSEGDYIDNNMTGHWIDYYENGNKSSEGDYKGDERNGHWINYYKNGNKHSEGDYIESMMNGHWINYDEIGRIWFEGDYRDDQKSGRWITYYSDGNILSEEDY